MGVRRFSGCMDVPSPRRQRITQAAMRLFAASRYDAVQIDDVARAAGVAKPTLYRYFATKQQLFLEGFDALLGELVEELDAIGETTETASLALPKMIRILLDKLGGDNADARLIGGSEKRFGTAARKRLCARARQIRTSLASVLRRGVEQHEFRDIDPDFVALAILGSVRMVATKTPIRQRAAAARAIAEIVTVGIAADARREAVASRGAERCARAQ